MPDKFSDNIIFLKFEDSKLPVFKEQKNKEWVLFGEEDNYPDYLLLLANKSAKHNAIINGKVNYIFGNGLKSTSSNANVTAWVNKCNTANEGMDELAIKAIKDCEVFGGFYWQIIPDQTGNIAEIYHVDFKKIRANEDRSKFYYKKDWSNRREEPKEFPKYTKGLKCAGIFSFKEYRQGQGVYPLPNYISAINYIESDYEVSKNTLSNAKTGFSASKFINFFNGEPTDEKKKEMEKRFKNKFTGSEGNKIIIGFNNDPAKKPTIDDLGASDLTKEDFTAVDNLITSNIYAGHQITSPMLFGIQEPGKLGQSNELKFAYDIFKNTYSNFKQKQIEAVINYFGEIIFGACDLKLQDVDPIGIPFTDQTIVQVAPIEWIWEKLGIDPAKYPNAKPAVQPVNPNVAPGAPEQMVNENLKNLTGRQHQGIMRIVKQFNQGKISQAQASLLLKSGYALTDDDVKIFLEIGDDSFSADFTEDEVAEIFSEFGQSKENFSIVKTRTAKFSEDEFAQTEIFASVQEASVSETDILALIKKDKRITNQAIADSLGVDISVVEESISRLESKGLLKTSGSIRDIIGSDKSNLPEIFIKYSYEVRPGAGAPIIPGTRPFCRKLVTLDRLYSRAEIQQISMRVGYSVWERRGGFWNTGKTTEPFCRHIWQSHIVIKKKDE